MAATITADYPQKLPGGGTRRTVRITWDDQTTVANAEFELEGVPFGAYDIVSCDCALVQNGGAATTVQPSFAWLAGAASGDQGFICQVAAAALVVRPVGLTDAIGAMPGVSVDGSLYINPVPDADLQNGESIDMVLVLAWP